MTPTPTHVTPSTIPPTGTSAPLQGVGGRPKLKCRLVAAPEHHSWTSQSHHTVPHDRPHHYPRQQRRHLYEEAEDGLCGVLAQDCVVLVLPGNERQG